MPKSFEHKKGDMNDEKRCVAEKVWEQFICTDKNPRIFIDAGSSAAVIAEIIKERKATDRTTPVVMTHNWAAWDALRRETDMDVYFIGGKYSPVLNACIEPKTFELQLETLTPNIMIIAVSGIDGKGLYCSNHQDEAPIKTAIAAKPVEKRIIIGDHTKIGDTDVRSFISLEELKHNCSEVYLLTDKFDYRSLEPTYKSAKYIDTLECFNKIHGGGCAVSDFEHSSNIIFVPVTPTSTATQNESDNPGESSQSV